MRTHLRLTLLSLSVSLALAACGGGGGGSDTAASGGQTGGNNNGSQQPGNTGGTGNPPSSSTFPSTDVSMLMSCPDTATGATAQCSGSEIAITEDKGNGVLVTNSGVQVFGKSTLDQPTKAEGVALATGGLAEMRLFKDANGTVSRPALLLSNLGIKWDGATERPKIIETFLPDAGRVTLVTLNNVKDVLRFENLQPATNTSFYNFNRETKTGTQENYANNRYFPRTAPPVVCPTSAACSQVETAGITVKAGDWRSTGTEPDETSGIRLHEDGDVSALNVPYPGSKGYRDLANYSYRYGNLAKWVSQDTVEIAEWTNKTPATEHTQNRRGVTAFGEVTNPTTIPTTGTATYKGWARGWYASTAGDPDPAPFRAEVTVTVDFAARTVKVKADHGTNVATNATLAAVNFETAVPMGAANTNVANYLTGTLAGTNLQGGLGGRYFGPVSAGPGGNGPAEIGASFRMQATDNSGAALVGGFIAINHAVSAQ